MTSVSNLIAAYKVVGELGHKIPINMLNSLLEIAKSDQNGETLSIHGLKERCGLTYAEAARHVYYWEIGNRNKNCGGHELVKVYVNEENRQLKLVKLSGKGRKLIDRIESCFDR